MKKTNISFLNADKIDTSFLAEFKTCFKVLLNELFNKTSDSLWSFNYSVQLFNRFIFIYYLIFFDCKNINTSPDEIIYDSYVKSTNINEFLLNIKNSKFFFNKLNNELFVPNKLDTRYNLLFSEPFMKILLSLLNSPHYVVSNLQPETICFIYEDLSSLIPADNNNRNNKGIFYTQKAEIELMCKLALAENISNQLNNNYKRILHQMVFSLGTPCENSIIKEINDLTLWKEILNHLNKIKIVDPACGGGLFLIYFLKLIDSLIKNGCKCIDIPYDQFEIRYNIAKNNLASVDIMEWACNTTKLNLYLLIISSESGNYDPNRLLNLNLIDNIKTGDSLFVSKRSNNSFSWKNDFSNILKNNNGFDIVISNPPYVRQENIVEPLNITNKKAFKDKKSYKNALVDELHTIHSDFFCNYNRKPLIKINYKSDLYIYFFFIGLSLLNKTGTLCFITSNSWLDVDFGKELQLFLLKKYSVKALIDNNHIRSFGQADINTVISLISLPNDIDNPDNDNQIRLITLNIPFESAPPELFTNSEPNTTKNQQDFRIIFKSQKQLLDEAYANISPTNPGAIKCLKLGGRYLRAPDIYSVLIKKADNKLIHLEQIASVNFGIKSGANNFFYLNNDTINTWNIESEFLKPFLFSLKEVEKYEVDKNNLKKFLFVCNNTKAELNLNNKVNALRYIEWGESQKYDKRPSVIKRKQWYTLPSQDNIHFVSNRFLGERFGFPWVEDIPVCDVFFVGKFKYKNPLLAVALLNSTISYLSAEILARKTYGIGVAYLYGPELSQLDLIKPDIFNTDQQTEIINIFNSMKNRRLFKIHEELKQNDRQQLDQIIFNSIGFTDIQRDELYYSLIKMVENRLSKANSINNM
ncbi:MAG: DNA methyltransferase [Cyanobacteriota bacterium]